MSFALGCLIFGTIALVVMLAVEYFGPVPRDAFRDGCIAAVAVCDILLVVAILI